MAFQFCGEGCKAVCYFEFLVRAATFIRVLHVIRGVYILLYSNNEKDLNTRQQSVEEAPPGSSHA